MTHIEPQFEQLPMRRREILRAGSNQYRVISADGEYKNIEANTAYEAFKLSGLTEAIKIERLADIKQIIFDRSKFKEDKPADISDSLADIMKAEAEEFEQIKRLRNPVISANDLDKIMRSFSSHVPAAQLAPEPAGSAGVEVHGDGFDEIIPMQQPAVKTEVKPVPMFAHEQQTPEPRAEIPAVSGDSTASPEQALSPEEVEKLLNG